jgi:hypothetical protein
MSVGMAECERHIDGKVSKETRYFICSIKADKKRQCCGKNLSYQAFSPKFIKARKKQLKGLKAKRFKAALDTEYAEKVIQLFIDDAVILPWTYFTKIYGIKKIAKQGLLRFRCLVLHQRFLHHYYGSL